MVSTSENLATAIEYHQAGRLIQASQLYQEILQTEPDQLEALQGLGAIAILTSSYDLAIECLSKAVAQNPSNPDLHYNLGNALREFGQQESAITHYNQALTLNPNYAEVYDGLGKSLEKLGFSEPAIASYQQAITLQPYQPQAWHNLGLALHKQGKLEAAIASYQQAIAFQSDCAEFHTNLAQALQEQQRLDEAISHYEIAIVLEPYHAKVYNWLGIALHEQRRLDEAIANYQQALFLLPSADIYNNLGMALQEQRRLDEAIANYQQALLLEPQSGEVYNNLGMALEAQQRLDEAISIYEQALLLQPNSVQIHINLGLALRKQRRIEAAIAHYQQALAIDPNAFETYTHLGNALRDRGEWEASIGYFQQVLALDPNYVDAYNGLGVTFSESGQLQAAITQYQKALSLSPNYLNAHYNLSIAWLKSGNFPLGFAAYEWRWQKEDTPPRPFSQPLWNGSSLKGKTILLHGEQGFGDQIQFIRYLPLVAQFQGYIIVECSPELVRLFTTVVGIDKLVVKGEDLPPFDVHAPLMSLPLILGTTLETIPAQIPYFYPTAATPIQIATFPNSYLKVGITWAGNPLYQGDDKRSCGLSYFLPLLNLPNIAFYSLQKGHRVEELTQAELPVAIQDLNPLLNDFADTASVLAQLDLIITTDTSVAHLAGALGKPTWVVLSFSPDWRWMLNREDSPWYSTLRLFRQSQLGDWVGVMQRVKQALIDNGYLSGD